MDFINYQLCGILNKKPKSLKPELSSKSVFTHTVSDMPEEERPTKFRHLSWQRDGLPPFAKEEGDRFPASLFWKTSRREAATLPLRVCAPLVAGWPSGGRSFPAARWVALWPHECAPGRGSGGGRSSPGRRWGRWAGAVPQQRLSNPLRSLHLTTDPRGWTAPARGATQATHPRGKGAGSGRPGLPVFGEFAASTCCRPVRGHYRVAPRRAGRRDPVAVREAGVPRARPRPYAGGNDSDALIF